jgi:hypothetical protein
VPLATGTLAAAVLLAFGWVPLKETLFRQPLPDARLTPGATLTTSRDRACSVPATDEGRMVRADLAMAVFERYRISKPRAGAYEIDYLISPALGGADDISNLWPVPYDDGVWTARVKDALEVHLRMLVCEGKLELETAQAELAANWIAAYRKYFRTDRPRAAHALFLKDSPWQ